MSKREAWEFRVCGIRSSGDTFRSYDEAIRRTFRALNHMHHSTEGAERDDWCRKEHECITVLARLQRERPKRDFFVKGTYHGKPWSLEVNRLPWGSAPSGAGRVRAA